MSTPNSGDARKRLPIQPSEENLKKQAKRRARIDAIQLAEAQHRIANDYGFPSWPKLVAYVASVRKNSGAWHSDPNDNLPKAANAGDVAKVRAMLAAGQYSQHDLDQALGRIVCNMGEYNQADRWIIADLLIDAGADPDGEYGGNYGPIVFGACEGINLEGIQWLIDKGADVSFAPIDTKYGKACPMGHLLGTYNRGRNEAKHKAVSLLLSKGAVVPAELTPEVFAIHRGDAKLLGEMIDADRTLLRRTFRDMPYGNINLAGATLLHCAVEFGEIECIDAILSRYRGWGDLDMNSKAEVIDGIGGQTPIYHAINTNCDRNFYTLEYLIQRNARFIDMGVKATWRAYGQPLKEPLTPLEFARKGESGMDPKWAHLKPHVKDEIALLVPLDRRALIRKATEAGDIEKVRSMLGEHPELLTGELWPGAIHKAKSLELVKLLLDRGLNPNDCPAPRKPLHLAAYYSLADIIELLIERGADANHLNQLDETPLDLIGEYEPHNNMSEQSRRSREALLNAGAKHNFHTAIRAGELKLIREMLDADPELVNTNKPWSGLFTAARTAQLDVAKLLLERGAKVDGSNDGGNTPLWFACQSSADAADRIAVAKLLLDAGANPRRQCEDQSTPLHFAAWRGPREMVELLIRHNAKTWLTDKDGKLPIDYAKRGVAPDRDAIVHLLDRPVIDDAHFRAAVNAVHAGDLNTLQQLLADHPNLSRDRAIEPACYLPTDYFGSPKLLWFIANNPTLIPTMPRNIVDLTRAIIQAGVDQADLDYTLGLVMTSSPAVEQGLLRPLMNVLLEHGATATAEGTYGTLGHTMIEPVQVLLDRGIEMNAPIAAALGKAIELKRLLANINGESLHAALSLAVINRQVETAAMCIDAGADVNRFLIVHVHSMPAHQAAVNDDVPMLQLLVKYGAKLDVKDTLWGGTPRGWAIHEKKTAAELYLRSIGAT
ncbi:hypothetical protein BH10PLA1_BH10PLA1_13060 [soil metagenome]